MDFKHNDGSNPKGVADCVARAIAISINRPYREIAYLLAAYMEQGGVNVGASGFIDFMEAHGFNYVTVITRRRVCELPANCIAHTAGHYSAVVNGVVNDTIDTRMEMVRGYWVFGVHFNVVAKGVVKNSAPMGFTAAVAMRRMLNLNYSIQSEISSI